MGLIKNMLYSIAAKAGSSQQALSIRLKRESDRANLNGLISSFTGSYVMSPAENPKIKAVTPFVLAQTEEQRERLKKGLLEATGYDLGKKSAISGEISFKDIKFVKIYLPNQHSELDEAMLEITRKMFESIGESFVPNNGYETQPNSIFYSGRRANSSESLEDELHYDGAYHIKNRVKTETHPEGIFDIMVMDPQAVLNVLK